MPAHCRSPRRAAASTAAAAVAVVAALASAVACTAESSAPAPSTAPVTIDPLAQAQAQEVEPVPTLPTPPGFVPADTRNVELPVGTALPRAEPPVPVFGGEARMFGRVFGPDGPVGGATVRLERFVGARGGFADVTADEDGNWAAEDVHGGRYRIRAFNRPTLATTEPQVAFVSAEADLQVDVVVDRYDRQRLQVALAVGNVQPDFPVELRVRRDQEEVDRNGVVQGVPLDEPQEVTIVVEEGMEIVGEDRKVTAPDGTVSFTLVCRRVGPHRLTATAGDLSTTIDLPPCEVPAGPAVATTSTTAPPSSTTSTTLVDVDIGEVLDLPQAGPVPPGTYDALVDGDACVTRYEELQADGTWVTIDAAGGRLAFAGVARNLASRPGTPACRFRRTS